MTTKNLSILLKGIAASSGAAEGIVKVVKGIEDAAKFQDGDVLVTRITDPAMVAMMSRAVAIVCDIGSITSHPSIVAREMGIPCVVNAKEATKKLKDGQHVRVDGTKGEIYEL